MTAEFRGRLVLDDEGCLRVEWPGHGSVVPIWPAGYKLDAGGNEIRIIDEEGRVAAKVGEEVYMGGGEIGRSLKGGSGGLSPRTARELEQRCPGTYWVVGMEVRIPQQG